MSNAYRYFILHINIAGLYFILTNTKGEYTVLSDLRSNAPFAFRFLIFNAHLVTFNDVQPFCNFSPNQSHMFYFLFCSDIIISSH
jgi:hypothetical protein